MQAQPGSTEQDELHPSLTPTFPSSQYPACGFSTFPSPQVSEQTLAVEELPGVHDQFNSTDQAELQPSPSTVLLSSQ